MSSDRFTKEETAEIIRRSLELQEKSKESPSGTTTALEIRAAAAEIGIDPRFIDQAISSRGRNLGTTAKKGFLGATKSVSYEGVFPGTLSEDQWVKTVQNLRANFGDKGELETLGSTREWFRTNSVAPVHFSVKSDGKESFVSTSVDLSSINFIPFLLGLPVWMLTSIALATSSMPPSIKAAVILLWFVTYLLIARLISRGIGKQLIAKMMQSVSDFQAVIQDNASSSDTQRDRLANASVSLDAPTSEDLRT